MSEKPQSYYRPMPRAYIMRWIEASTLVYTVRLAVIAGVEWPGLPEFLWMSVMSAIGGVVGGYFGAYLWGWIFWRVGLYKQFPPIEGFPLYWYPNYNRRKIAAGEVQFRCVAPGSPEK
jgi:hypothetical protein